jgi:uncharacterized HAD superfamily protein
MDIFVDIDGTICDGDFPYNNCTPMKERIAKINSLYDSGDNITYWTARGGRSGVDFTQITKSQLSIWGAKYHNLIMGNKPSFDLYICDKSINSNSYFNRIIGQSCGMGRK